MKKLILLIVFFLFCFLGKAQPRFSLNQCIDYAYKQNFDVKLKELKFRQSENTLEQSQKALYPSVSGSFSQGINSGRSIDPFTNGFIQRTISSNSFGANANLVLFNGFSLKNQILQNQLNAEADQVEIQRAKNELRVRVTLAFMQVLMNQELAKIAQEQIQNIQTQYERVKALVNEGNMPKTNLIDLDAQLATAEFDALNAKNNIELSKLSLAQLMAFSTGGEPHFTAFEIENNINDKSMVLEVRLPTEDYLQNMLLSVDNQPIMRSIKLRLQISKVGIKLAEAGKYPSVSLGAGLGSAYSSAASKEYNYFNQLGFNLNQFARLSVNIPIYTNGQVRGRITNAEINQRIAETQLSQTKLQLKQEIEQAYLATKIAQDKHKAAQKQVSAQQIAYDSAKERYLEGLLHTVELNTFRINLEKAKSNLIQAKYEFYFRKIVLDYYRQ